jgi:hypothetical protein
MSPGTNLCRTNAAHPARPFTFVTKLVPILLLFSLLGSSTTVLAACGDHVQSRRTRDLLVQMTRPVPSDQVPLPTAPCRGPGCHRGPTESPAAPAPVVRDDAGHSGLRAETTVGFVHEDGSEEFVELSIVLRDGVLAGIFRPPEPTL